MEFYDVVASRHSVRRFKSDPVPEASVDRIIEAFRRAPSWANSQPWELLLATEPPVKIALQSTVSRTNPAFRAVQEAPLLACIIGILGVSGWYKRKTVTDRGDWFMFDCGIAAEHLVLAAAAEGLGSVHIGLFDAKKAGELLCLPENRTVVELIPLGYPNHTPRRIERKSPDDFLHFNTYGERRRPMSASGILPTAGA